LILVYGSAVGLSWIEELMVQEGNGQRSSNEDDLGPYFF